MEAGFIKIKKRKKVDWRVYVIFLPCFFFVTFLTLYPMLKMVVMSFFDWQIGYMQTSPYVGLKNYIDVFSDPIARLAIGNTLAYAAVTVPFQIIIGLFSAILIHSITKFSVTFRLAYYLPVISSWVVVALLFRYIFSNFGLLNYFLVDIIHISNEPIGWLGSRWPALFTAMLLGIWKGVGWNMVVFLAALQAVSKEQYEAAAIDGAGRFQKFFFITLPNIRGTLLFVVIMLVIGAFNTYTPITVLTNGNPAHQTEVVLTWMYFQTFEALNMGYSAALSVIVALLIVIVTVLLFGISARRRRA
jgi:multiple sugar transport system permease protein